jgi:hypothetical protein
MEDSRSGLISLKSLEAVTAQLPPQERRYRVTVVSCDGPVADRHDLKHDVVKV